METRVLEKKETRFRDAKAGTIRDDKVEFADRWCLQIQRAENYPHKVNVVARLWELVQDENWVVRAKWKWDGFKTIDDLTSVAFKLGGQDVLLWKGGDDLNRAFLCRLGYEHPTEQTVSGSKWVGAIAITDDSTVSFGSRKETVKWATLSGDRLSLWDSDFHLVASLDHGCRAVNTIRWHPGLDGKITFFICANPKIFTASFDAGSRRFESDVKEHANLCSDVWLPETDRLTFVVSRDWEMRWNEVRRCFEDVDIPMFADRFNDDFCFDWVTPVLYARRGKTRKSLRLGYNARSFVTDQSDAGVVWGLSWKGKRAMRFRFVREIPTLRELAVDAYAKACFDGLGDRNLKARFAAAVDSNRQLQEFPLTQLLPVSLRKT